MQQHITEIKEQGFTVLKSQLSLSKVREIKDTILRINESFPKPTEETTPRLNRESDVVYNPEQKDRIFTKTVFANETLGYLLRYFLNDEYYRQISQDKPNYILRAMIARSSSKSELPLHIDSFIPSAGERPFVMQTSMILDHQDNEAGCTVVVPGSHLSDNYAPQQEFKNAIPVHSEPGDIVIWDSRLWHGALSNKSKKSRWALIATFTRWWIKQNYNITKTLPKEIYWDMTDEEKSVMGYCCIPPQSEFERIDIKAGYEVLK
jgi:ectoine hydroxylase-related dioxygenase (phytanoyl-CoA dioxygenase family)